VDVDPARGDDQPLGVELATGQAAGVVAGGAGRSDLDDASAVDGDVADEGVTAGAIDHEPVADHQIDHVQPPRDCPQATEAGK
jgi:hypothetical protein